MHALPLTHTHLHAFPRNNKNNENNASPHDGIARGKIGLNALQRRTAKLALNAGIPVYPFSETAGDVTMAALNVTVDLMVKGKGRAKQVCARVSCVLSFLVLLIAIVRLNSLSNTNNNTYPGAPWHRNV